MTKPKKDCPYPISCPMVSLSIGDWERISRHEGDLVAIVYYSAKRLIWEVLDGTVLRRIEISWDDISAIGVATRQKRSVLEVRVRTPPLFYRKMETPPRHHPNWQKSNDFTEGIQASLVMVHRAYFSPGMPPDNLYEQILQCDPRLLKLSQSQFPIMPRRPYFGTFPLSPSSAPLYKNTSPIESSLRLTPSSTSTASDGGEACVIDLARSPTQDVAQTTQRVLDEEAIGFPITQSVNHEGFPTPQTQDDHATPEPTSSSWNLASDNDIQHVQGACSKPIGNSTPTPQGSNHNHVQMEANYDSGSEVDENFHLSFLNDTEEI